MKKYKHLYKQIISLENLFLSWQRFRKGKSGKKDVMIFEYDLEQNIFQLHHHLKNKTYTHQPYTHFYVCDPKVRHISKASVVDRVVHHALFNILNPLFEPTFISNSFSCRVGKGNHKGVRVLEAMVRKVSKNYTKPCFALKCDVQKFFDSVDHQILLGVIKRRIKDPETLWLLERVINSYSTSIDISKERERG